MFWVLFTFAVFVISDNVQGRSVPGHVVCPDALREALALLA